MPDLNATCAEIAEIIKDYREGEIARPTSEHALQWVEQFDAPDREIVALETCRVLKKLYASKTKLEGFVSGLITTPKLCGPNPSEFWRDIGFLSIQQQSHSQRDLLSVLDAQIQGRFNVRADHAASANATYIYIDDGIFTGTQVWTDIARWLENNDIRNSTLHIVVAAWHVSGQWYANKKLVPLAAARGVKLGWWRETDIEDWRKPGNEARVQVLWPRSIPQDPSVNAWLALVPDDRAYFNVRPQNATPNPFFSSESNRDIFEQALLKKGAYIRTQHATTQTKMRPLGCSYLRGYGFGTMFATYRNCPNSCPLPLWWGLGGWHPLLPRRVRAE